MKKVLIITYYWPPAGGPGVQRVLKFVKYLPEFGWEPIILTVKNGEYPAVDQSLLSDISNDVIVYKTDTIEFFKLFKHLSGRSKNDKIETYILNKNQVSFKDRIFRWIRQNLFVPDARIGWKYFAVRKGFQIIKSESPAVIFSSSPPHSLQLIAHKLSQRTSIPWVADFRDPWTQAFWDKDVGRTHWAENKNIQLEKKVISNAQVISAVSKGVVELLTKHAKYQSAEVISNGFDEEDFNDVDISKKINSTLDIVYAGHMAHSQHPQNLIKAISSLSYEYRNKLNIHFYGSVDQSVKQDITQRELQTVIHLKGYVSHSKIIEIIQQADILLLLIPNNQSKGILTGKIFEYLATGNYILGIGNPEGEASAILQETNAGKMYSYNTSMQTVLEQLISRWESDDLSVTNNEAIEKYTRKALTRELARIFDSLCN